MLKYNDSLKRLVVNSYKNLGWENRNSRYVSWKVKKYPIVLSKNAQKQLDKLPDNIAEPIFEAISGLGENPRPVGYKKLKGRNGYRIRTGNYRIIYDIFDTELVVDVITLGHRKSIYD